MKVWTLENEGFGGRQGSICVHLSCLKITEVRIINERGNGQELVFDKYLFIERGGRRGASNRKINEL